VIRVLHLITSFGLGGAETSLAQLVRGMHGSRFVNSVVVMRRLPPRRQQVPTQKVGLHCLEMRPSVPNPLAAARLLRIMRSEQPHVLQTWMYHADLLGLVVARLGGVPNIVWNIRRSFFDVHEHSRLSGMVLRILVRLSGIPAAVVTNSLAGQRTHQSLGYDPRRWVWIPNSIDCERFKPNPEERTRLRSELGLPHEASLIGLIARYLPIKGHDVFVAAASKLAASDSSVHFILAGNLVNDTNTTLMRLINLSGARERFHLLGEREDIERILAALDVVCSSSHAEGFPNVIGEAMACGVPCVVTDVGDSALLVGSFGKVVPAGNSSALYSSCEQLLSSKAERQTWGREARHRIERCFSVKSMVARYEELYEELAYRDLVHVKSA
jgi:glycosyltransferase involved in cell wall biosynthesis